MSTLLPSGVELELVPHSIKLLDIAQSNSSLKQFKYIYIYIYNIYIYYIYIYIIYIYIVYKPCIGSVFEDFC